MKLFTGIILFLSIKPIITSEFSEVHSLNGATVPLNYFLYLDTNLHNGTLDYSGSVVIDIKIIQYTNEIVLHASDLIVLNIELKDFKENVLNVNSIRNNNEFDLLIIELTESLIAINDTYKLTISFESKLKTNDKGFFYTIYYDDFNVQHPIGATNFKRTNARTAFPCYDEPQLKAAFSLEIKHHSSQRVFSSMDGDRTVYSENSDFVVTKFEKSKKMSTYSFGFVVADLKYVNRINEFPKQKIYSRFYETENLGNIASKLLNVLQKYLDINYNQPILYHAIVSDLNEDILSSYGLIIHKEHGYYSRQDSISIKQWYNTISSIANGISCQFFEHMMSPNIWASDWITQGLTSLFQNYGLDLVYPQQRFMDMFVINQLHNSLLNDFEYNVDRKHRYATIMRMIQHFVSEHVFKYSLTELVTEHQLKTVTDEDFYEILEKNLVQYKLLAMNISVSEVINTWIKVSGYPVLTVSRNYTTNEIILSQQPFSYHKIIDDKETWIIPYNYITEMNENNIHNDIMPKKLYHKISVSSLSDTDWIIFNIQQTGYYRVNYDERNWALIINFLHNGAMSFKKIHPINRAQIIDDSFNLARAGIIPYDIPMNIALYLKYETDYIPWAAASNNFDYIFRMLYGTTLSEPFYKMLKELFVNLISEIGYIPKEGESIFQKLTRSIAFQWLYKLNVSEFIEFTSNMTLNYIDRKIIDINLKEEILCSGMRPYNWIGFYETLLNYTDRADRIIILNALGCVDDKYALEAILFTTIDENFFFYKADRNRLFNSILTKTHLGLQITIDFVAKYVNDINRLYQVNDENISPIEHLIINMAAYVVNVDDYELFESGLLFKLNLEINASVIVLAGSIAKRNILWRNEYLKYIVQSVEHVHGNSFGTDLKSSSFNKLLVILLLCIRIV